VVRGDRGTIVEKSEKQRAVHETGHAVVARVLGVAVTYVTMFPTRLDNNAAAQTRSATFLARHSSVEAIQIANAKDAKIALAGNIAERRYRPNDKSAKQGFGAGEDAKRAQVMAQTNVLVGAGLDLVNAPASIDVSPEQNDVAVALLHKWWDETVELVDSNWHTIRHVAKALQQRRFLDPETLDKLIAEERSAPAAATNAALRR
jgi:ATP-dependent Zn protease